VRAHGQRVLEGGADFLVTSVGAFTDTTLFDRLLAAARANGRRLILPSAGIGALDILSSAAVGGLDSVTVTVRKDPSAWKGTVAETLVDLDALTAPHTVFDGPVREGARLYPQNVNISAAAAIAGIGLDRTRVVIVADPTIRTHIVELEAERRLRPLHFRRTSRSARRTARPASWSPWPWWKSVRQLASTWWWRP
jgi:aspartate dehydrogenase